LAAFPLAYAVILHAFMLPLVFMLLGLIFRGVAFEFRFKATPEKRHWWDKAFIFGSFTATFFQGVVLGGYMNGLTVVDRVYTGGVLDWITPFSIFTGLGLIVAYALLGCTWLILKTEGLLYDRMRSLARPLTFVLLAVIVIISIWTPLIHASIAERWFSFPNLIWFLPVPVLVAIAAYFLLAILGRKPHAG